MRYLGIDYGTKKVGLALSDEAGTMGFPKGILPNDARLMEAIRAVAAAENVSAVVIGDSRDFSGKENPVAKEAKEFGTKLTLESGLPVFYENEMLTTQEARRGFDGKHPDARSDKERRGAATEGAVDASAAALILTSYLSRTHD